MPRAVLSAAFSKKPGAVGSGGSRAKLIFLLVVIVAALGWIGYLTLSGPSNTVTEVPPIQVSIGAIEQALAAADKYKFQTVGIALVGEPPNQHIEVSGTVKSAAILEELRTIVTSKAGGAPVDVHATVRP